MKRNILCLIVVLLTCSVYNTSAQSQRKQPLQLVTYNDNVKAPLSAKELSFIKEVYADKYVEYVANNPQKLKDLKNLLRNRIVIKQLPSLVANKGKYKVLSEAGLFNSYNTNLKFDINYNKKTFNVLKYNLEFFGRGSRLYRIDNTDYFIFIKSQHQ